MQSEAFERQRPKKGRCSGHGMRSGANIVNEPWQRQFGAARAAAKTGLRFVDNDSATGLRERDGRSEAIGARADDDGIMRRRLLA